MTHLHSWTHLYTDDGLHSSFVEGHVDLTPEFIAAAEEENREAVADYEASTPEHFHLRQMTGAEEEEFRAHNDCEGPIFDWCKSDAPDARAVTGYYWQGA